MKEKINNFLKNRAIKNTTDIKLKDLFLKTNKEEVVNFAIKLINKKKAIDIDYEEEEFEKSLLKDKAYLSQKYDYFLNLCKNNYSNELSKKYVVNDEFGSPFGFGEFLSVLNIEEYLQETEVFFRLYPDYKALCPIELFLDCYILKGVLKRYKEHVIVARFLLQAIFTEEENSKI